MKTPNELLKIAAQTNITVLIQGESGTGKEVAARYLHKSGLRAHGPFVAVNCGAIAKNLIESTLEGAKRGSYTGANADQPGVVRAAEGGTLFLDEIGELPYECQSRLLRILQERAVMPIGATRSIPVDFRLVCATNRNLREEVAAGRFREDLFFRLNAFPVQLSPLRERGDFETLAQELWQEALAYTTPNANIAHKVNQEPKVNFNVPLSCTATPPCKAEYAELRSTNFCTPQLNGKELAHLRLYKWPGNIRQLKNVLQRYALLRPHGIALPEILADEYSTIDGCPPNKDTLVSEPAIATLRTTPPWATIETTLQKLGGNKQKTAQALGISRTNLYLQIKKAAALSRAV